MRGFFGRCLGGIRKEIQKHPLIYLALTLILVAATTVRVYNVSTNLGFYYDQGRDALVIWDFWKNGNLFLIGPTTGIAGVFRGPWYYWLITPAYILGGGNPVYPAVFLSLTTVAAIFFLFLVARELENPVAGLIAGTITAFSYYIVVHSKWLSNPTPMLLISIMLLWALVRFVKGPAHSRKRQFKAGWLFPLIGFLAGMAIQFGSASEIFYLPAIIVVAFWKRKNLPSKRILVLSGALFFVSFIPQILFDILKGGILTSAIVKFLFGEESFRLSFWEVLGIRLNQYYQLFTSIITLAPVSYTLPFIFLGLGIICANSKKFIKNNGFRVLLIFLSFPLIGMVFFQGNYGNVFDYYFSGLYLPAVLLFCLPLGYVWHNWGGKIAVATFLILFFISNTPVLVNYLKHTRTHFTFTDQKAAIEWIYETAGSEEFNVDVYVPPVIPYAYDYLFKWLPSTRSSSLRTSDPSTGSTSSTSLTTSPLTTSSPNSSGPRLVEEQMPMLFTLYELDPPSPDRLDKWLARQSTIGKVESEASFGGITVQKRQRL